LLQFQMSQVSFADLHRGRLSREQAISNLSRHLAKDRISESFLPSFVRNFETEKIGDKSQAEGNYLLTTEFAGIDVQLLPIDRTFCKDQLMNVADPTEPLPTMSRAMQA